MKSTDGGHLMHNVLHMALPFALASIFLLVNPSLDPYDVIIVALIGGLSPDIDHINIWFEYKFNSFKNFIKFVTKARRYRYSFLIFHNMGFMIFLTLLILVVNTVSPLGTVFLTTFLFHLSLDFFDDKISIGRVTHWRYRRRT